MKKIIIYLFCIIAAAGSTACSKQDGGKNKASSSASASSKQSTAEISSVTTTGTAVVAPVQGEPSVSAAELSSEKRCYGVGNDVNEENRPVGAQMMQDDYGSYDAYFISQDDKCVYLTFDEGYENGYTEKILDTLKEKQVSATFFVTYDYAKRNPELIKRMLEEGHTVGNHSWSHPSMPDLSVEEARKEITLLHDYMKEKFSCEMTLFRPPMGEFSEQSLAVAKELGYKSVFWSFAYRDWETDNQMGADAAYEQITSRTHSGEIALLHAVSKDNAEILGRVIDYWQSKGLTVKAFE